MPPELSSSARELLANPEVLRAAWLRIDGWYRSGNLAPQPELAGWRLRPQQRIRELSREIGSGDWTPSEWPQIPYPKKKHILRHYVMPTVRDQVGFMGYLVLLGPWIDAAAESFVFGNRWDQPLVWDHLTEEWKPLPYEFISTSSYRSYGRTHGLYRRVASWTVAALTGSETSSVSGVDEPFRPEVFSDDFLPPWVGKKWWNGGSGAGRRAYWAKLDVALAYPSVMLESLERNLREMIGPGADTKVRGYPPTVRSGLEKQEVRLNLAVGLANSLKAVAIEPNGITRDMWVPGDKAGPQQGPRIGVPGNGIGLPTGLAVSGLLLNAALWRADRSLMAFVERERDDGRWRSGMLRFADDLTLIADSPSELVALIDAAWSAIGEDGPEGTLIGQRPRSNLCVNINKIEPDAVKNLVRRFLEAGREAAQGQSLRQWWGSAPPREKQAIERGLHRSSVGPDNLGPFVTTLVERMSAIGRDTLSERFGEGAEARLRELHDLARMDIEDEEVRADTRRSFAANRLARSWLTGEPEVQENEIRRIRDSIAIAQAKTPWKFALWRAIVRAAGRRSGFKGSEGAAIEWLRGRLALVASVPGTVEGAVGWLERWPEAEGDGVEAGSDLKLRALYLSYHRTAFWHALSETLATTWAHTDLLADAVSERGPPHGVSPSWWTVRALPLGDDLETERSLVGDLRTFLASFDVWAKVLYGDEVPDGLPKYPWELDQLVVACHAATGRREMRSALARTPDSGPQLGLPADLGWLDQNQFTQRILRKSGRLWKRLATERLLAERDLSLLLLSGPEGRVRDDLFPQGGPPAIDVAPDDTGLLLDVARALNAVHYLAQTPSLQALPTPADLADLVAGDPLSLSEYATLRRAWIAKGGEA